MLKQGRLSQVGLMAALLKSVGRLKRRGGSSPSSSAVKLKLYAKTYWRIIRYKTLIIQCVPEGKPEKRFCYESSVGKPCAFTGKACSDFKCINRADGLRVRYIKVDYRVYVNRI